MPVEWDTIIERQVARHADAIDRLPVDTDARQKQLVRAANASLGAGLAGLMCAWEEAPTWLARAATLYRQSLEGAPPESWGRLIGALKMRVLAGDTVGAREDAGWALAQGPAAATSPIGRYAACLAYLVLEQDAEALVLARSLVEEQAGAFPAPVARALAALAAGDSAGYEPSLREVVRSFETREAYLEDVPIADTALLLDRLADARGLAVHPRSELLPAL